MAKDIEKEKELQELKNQVNFLKEELNQSKLNSELESYNEILFNDSPYSILITDKNGDVIYNNNNAQKLYKLTVKEFSTKSCFDLTSLIDLQRFRDDFEKCKTEGNIKAEYQINRGFGRVSEILRQIVPINDNGNFQGAILFDTDISETLRIEEMLNLWNIAIESAANAIVVTNIRGDAVLVNPAFTNLTGYSAEEIVYKNLRILNSGQHGQEFYKNLWDTILAGKVWRGVIINSKKDGSEYIQEQTITPVYNKKGELTYFIAVQQDITDKRKAEEQARIQHEQLIQADKMIALGTLVSGVAHEINNPNNFVMLNVPLLEKIWQSVIPILNDHYEKNGDFFVGNRLKYSKIRSSVPVLLNGIREGSVRIKKIVQELKDFARKDASDMNQELDVNEIVEAAVSLTSNLIGKSTNNFKVHLGKNISRTVGNFQRLEQVLINLLENSCQALKSRDAILELVTSSDENSVYIKVIDGGNGIDPKIIKEITDPFFTTKRDTGGTGLGLSVSSKIVINHGGSLDFDSAVGKGTTATISLPIRKFKKIL